MTAFSPRAAQLTVPTAKALSILYWHFQHQEAQFWLPTCLLRGCNLSTARKLSVNWRESLVAELSFLMHYVGVSTKHFHSTKARTAHANSITRARSPPQQYLRACI